MLVIQYCKCCFVFVQLSSIAGHETLTPFEVLMYCILPGFTSKGWYDPSRMLYPTANWRVSSLGIFHSEAWDLVVWLVGETSCLLHPMEYARHTHIMDIGYLLWIPPPTHHQLQHRRGKFIKITGTCHFGAEENMLPETILYPAKKQQWFFTFM